MMGITKNFVTIFFIVILAISLSNYDVLAVSGMILVFVRNW